MENGMKKSIIKDLEKDLKLKISELKKEQQVLNTLKGLKMLNEDEEQKDELIVILNKLQMFAEKQIVEEIKVYEDVLFELQQVKPIETTGMVA